MTAIQAQDIADLVKANIGNLGKARFQLISQKLQTYEMVGKWLRDDRVMFHDGHKIVRTIQARQSSQAEHVGLFDRLSVDIPDLLDQLTVNWVRCVNKWALIYETDILMNRGESQILNLVKSRRADCLIGMAEELEAKAWSVPASTDSKLPLGLPVWIVPSATRGFHGKRPNGYTTLAGIDPNSITQYANYTDGYTAASKLDLIKKARRAHLEIRWRNAVTVADFRKGMDDDLRIYVDYTLNAALEDIGEGQNENLGRDIAPMGTGRDVRYVDDVLTFRRAPIVPVPQMNDTNVFVYKDVDGNTRHNPFLMVDHSTFYVCGLDGNYLRESGPYEHPEQPGLFRNFVHLTYQFLNVDRRRNASITAGAALSA